jgi:hypothetical protein
VRSSSHTEQPRGLLERILLTLTPALLAWFITIFPSISIAKEVSYDILPESWFTYSGEINSGPATGRILVLPTPQEIEGSFKRTLPGFLLKGNQLGTGTFEFKTLADDKIQIKLARLRPHTADVSLEIEPPSYRLLRRLDWPELRRLQHEFEQYLFKASECDCFWSLFSKPPRQRFGATFESSLLGFWLDLLGSAIPDSLSKSVFGSLPFRPPNPNGKSPGEKMGVYPLYPGMRLSIHWGGTANYQFQVANVPLAAVVRPTVAGATTLDVVVRDGRIAFGTNQDWRLASDVPYEGDTNGGNPLNLPAPFGTSEELNAAFRGHVLPVFNELDLWQPNGLGKVEGKTPLRAAILVPGEYIKPDLAQPTGAGKPANAVLYQDSLGVSETPNDKQDVAKSLSRHFILWRANSIALDFVPEFTPDKVANWPPALVFGNQTFITPELPVLINGQTPVWLTIGGTWGDVLRTYAPWLLGEDPDSSRANPILSIRRALPSPEQANDTSERTEAANLRFWVLPKQQLLSAQVYPGDAFFFHP